MKKLLAFILLLHVIFMPFTSFAMLHTLPKKSNKGKNITAAALLAVGIATGYHAYKIRQAIKKADIKPSDELLYYPAIQIVALLGPLGALWTLQLLTYAVDNNYLSRVDVAAMIYSKIGDALAYYFGYKKPLQFKILATAKGLQSLTRLKKEDVKKENIIKSVNKIIDLTKKAPVNKEPLK